VKSALCGLPSVIVCDVLEGQNPEIVCVMVYTPGTEAEIPIPPVIVLVNESPAGVELNTPPGLIIVGNGFGSVVQ
jgi:hypothetical protein